MPLRECSGKAVEPLGVSSRQVTQILEGPRAQHNAVVEVVKKRRKLNYSAPSLPVAFFRSLPSAASLVRFARFSRSLPHLAIIGFHWLSFALLQLATLVSFVVAFWLFVRSLAAL